MFTKIDMSLPNGPYEIGKVEDGYQGLDIEILKEDDVYIIPFEDKMAYRVMNESITSSNMWANCEID